MLNRFIEAGSDFGHSTARRSSACVVVVRDVVSGFMTTIHHALMVLGIGAIGALVLMFVRPDVTDHLKALSPFTAETAQQPAIEPIELTGLMDTPSNAFAKPAPAGAPLVDAALVNLDAKKAALSQEQRVVAKWLSRRYRVAGDATYMLVSATYQTAHELHLDPLLILAVAAIESGFNPYAESSVGAQGLMQVMSKLHHDKFRELGGVKAALDPVANIKVGARILKEYVRRGGSVEAGLKMYVGAAAFETDFGYGSRVLGEYRRLKDVAAGKNVPAFSTVAKAPQKPAAPETAAQDKTTTSDEGKSAALEPQPRANDAEAEQVVAL